MLVTDLIPEEAESWTQNLLQHRLDPIFLVAPTTSDKRLARIAQQAHGFIYAVSRAGVTGERDEMTRDAEALVKRVRSVSDLPVAVGFGISSPEQVRAVWRFADAAVVRKTRKSCQRFARCSRIRNLDSGTSGRWAVRGAAVVGSAIVSKSKSSGIHPIS